MFKSVRIQNFRQFKDLKLDNLAQINLITGANNTGKTSLLEGLFLLTYPEDPSRTVTLAGLRGAERVSAETPELWEWLFTDRDSSRPIEIVADERADPPVGGSVRSRLLVYLNQGSLIPTTGSNGNAANSAQPTIRTAATAPLPELMFQYSGPTGDALDTVLRWTGQGLLQDPDRRHAHRATKRGFFLSDAHHPSELDADRLSNLQEHGREQPLVDALRIVEPRLKRLTVLTHGGRPSVYADLGYFPLVPLAMLGKGFSRLLTIVSALILTDGTTVLIDELENGFHYSTLPDVWRVIVSAALEHSAQVFVTTHSWECLEAAVKGSDGHEGSLAFYRLDRVDDEIHVVEGSDSRLRSAVRVGYEIR